MLDNGKYRSAEILIRKAIHHNKSILDGLNALIQASYESNKSRLNLSDNEMEDHLKKQSLANLCYDEKRNLVKYFYCPVYTPGKGKLVGLVSNYVRVTNEKSNALLEELVAELNETCDAILALKGDAE